MTAPNTAAPRRKRKRHKPPLEGEVRLQEWAAKGASAAQFESRRVAVDRGIPGELVAAAIQMKTRPPRGVVTRVLEPSPDRVAAPCPFYHRDCGGCQLQHLAYAVQLRAKVAGVEAELRAAGVDATVDVVRGMSEPWRYRRTGAIAIGWEAGFRPRGRRGIVAIDDCLISHPLIGQVAARCNSLLAEDRLPNYHGKVWLDCTVVGSTGRPAVQILLQGMEGLTLESHPELHGVAAVLASIDGVESVAFRHRSGEALPLVGPLMSRIEVDGRSLWLPAGSFFQTNLSMLEEVLGDMRRHLERRSRITGPPRRAADVYGGVGTFALALAGEVDEMSLVELDAAAVEAARRTAADWKLENVQFVSRHAERALPDLPGLDLAIVDPPRSGLGERTTSALLADGVPFVLYLSCSPASLARDLAVLTTGGYGVESLTVYDFYPQTYHVECLAVLVR